MWKYSFVKRANGQFAAEGNTLRTRMRTIGVILFDFQFPRLMMTLPTRFDRSRENLLP